MSETQHTEAEMQSAALAVPACNCDTCQAMCQRPCWPTPGEAERLIDAGYAGRLMLDYWAGSEETDYRDILLVCPAEVGREGRNASFIPMGGCTMLVNDLCILHDAGLKPLEGRLAHHCSLLDDTFKNKHFSIAMLWQSDKGRAVVDAWHRALA